MKHLQMLAIELMIYFLDDLFSWCGEVIKIFGNFIAIKCVKNTILFIHPLINFPTINKIIPFESL